MSQMRCMVFIDGSNLFGAYRQIGFKIDLQKLFDVLVAGRPLLRPCYYCAIPETPSQKQINFHRMLKYLGFRVVTKTLKSRSSKSGGVSFVEKGVDVALRAIVSVGLNMVVKNSWARKRPKLF